MFNSTWILLYPYMTLLYMLYSWFILQTSVKLSMFLFSQKCTDYSLSPFTNICFGFPEIWYNNQQLDRKFAISSSTDPVSSTYFGQIRSTKQHQVLQQIDFQPVSQNLFPLPYFQGLAIIAQSNQLSRVGNFENLGEMGEGSQL